MNHKSFEPRAGVARSLGSAALLLVLVLACAAAAPPASAQGVSESAYTLGALDAVQIQVWQRPGLSGTFEVDDQGRLNLPLIGAVDASGKTVAGLREELERRFAVMDPGITQVLVTVVGFNSRRVTVVGEVRAPGVYTFREDPTLWEAILQAGGATPNADMGEVQVVRESGGGPATTTTVDLSRGLEGTPPESVPVLRPGDSVVVPALGESAVSGDRVQVLGAVRTPGLYALRTAGTVVEAISVSGGHLDGANLGDVRLARPTGNGTIVYRLDVDGYLNAGYPPANLPLRPGDTITVPSGNRGASSVFRTVLQVSGFFSAVAGLIIAADRLQ